MFRELWRSPEVFSRCTKWSFRISHLLGNRPWQMTPRVGSASLATRHPKGFKACSRNRYYQCCPFYHTVFYPYFVHFKPSFIQFCWPTNRHFFPVVYPFFLSANLGRLQGTLFLKDGGHLFKARSFLSTGNLCGDRNPLSNIGWEKWP